MVDFLGVTQTSWCVWPLPRLRRLRKRNASQNRRAHGSRHDSTNNRTTLLSASSMCVCVSHTMCMCVSNTRALLVPVLHLQATTLPPVNRARRRTIGANFRLVEGIWRWRHAKVDRAVDAAGDTATDDPARRHSRWVRHTFSIETLLTINNATPEDVVAFEVPAARPGDDRVTDALEVLDALNGAKTLSKVDAWASWVSGLGIARHTPDTAAIRAMRSVRPLVGGTLCKRTLMTLT